MKHLKALVCSSLLILTFSCYGQDTSNFHKEDLSLETNTTSITYAKLSNLLKLKKIDKVIQILQAKPTLISLLTSTQVKEIGWENWVIINKNIINLMPPTAQSNMATPLEIDTWVELLDKNIFIKLLDDKLEIALIEVLETDWYNWNELKDELPLKEKQIFKNKIKNKIKYLTNKENKEAILKLFNFETNEK